MDYILPRICLARKRKLAIDLYCGLGGWTHGLIAEDYDVVGFDLERHAYGAKQYPAQLVLQNVLTLHGSQFRNADLIVASPPCQEFSYMAMPWKRGKQIARALRGEDEFPDKYKGSRTVAELTALFDACFRIQREASAAAGRYIPLVVENVKGAQPWVGKAKANYGSYYLWGDVPVVLPYIPKAQKFNPDGQKQTGGNPVTALKVPGMNFHEFEKTGQPGRSFQSAAVKQVASGPGVEYGGDFGWDGSAMRPGNSHSPARKAASAMIAEIPFPLAQSVARYYRLPSNRQRIYNNDTVNDSAIDVNPAK